MENLNREAILRMLSGKTGNSSSGGGGGDIDLAGYATSIWVTENFVSIDFFRELFRAFDSNSQEILPNDTTSVVNNIKAMVGLWTEQYLTALGNQSGGGGGGGGAQYLNDLLDVQLTTPLTDGQALVYNATLQKWVNGSAGVNMTTVWNALAGSTNEQINASHLSTALSGYVTTSAISDMATQTWVGQQGFATQTWVTSNFITIAYFDRLFRAYNGSTLVSHNDTTSTIDNIKAMFGFWTDFYLSALGTGGVSSVSISLSQLADVTLTSPTGGQALVYDATNNKWVNGTIQTGVSTLSSLSDVLLTSLQHNQVLIYDAYAAKWVNTSLKTINSQSLIGSGDISVGGGASGNYLPLTGGTLTGTLTVGNGVSAGHVYLTLNRQPYYDGGILMATGGNYDWQILNQSNRDLTFYSYTMGNIVFRITGAGEVMSKALYYGTDAGGSFMEAYVHPFRIQVPDSNNNYSVVTLQGGGLHVSSFIQIESSGNEQFINFKYNSTFKNQIDAASGGFAIYSFRNSNFYNDFYITRSNGYIGLGTSYPSYKLHVDGDVYATGGVTALSDIRHKTIIKDAAVSVEDIARMPAVMYQWNDGREDKKLHVGSIAQNWQTVLPEVVLKANDKEGTLSMQYGVAALVSSIIIARKVVNHEDRIKQLEKENKELKERLKIA